MKTDKFEKTIRRKLESISPDFHEADWTKMQNYMQAHTPPTFWQQYGSWLGYAAAASVSTVMAFLYVHQLTRNNNLISDVKQLQDQIEVIKGTPTIIRKTDTVYIVQKELIKEQINHIAPQNYNLAELQSVSLDLREIDQSEHVYKDNPIESKDILSAIEKPVYNENQFITPSEYSDPVKERLHQTENRSIAKNNIDNRSSERTLLKGNKDTEFLTEKSQVNSTGDHSESNLRNSPKQLETGFDNKRSMFAAPVFRKTLDGNFSHISEIQTAGIYDNSRQMNYALMSRLAPRQVKRFLLASVPARPEVEDKKVEKATKAENVIPKLNIKVPYRFGGGIHFEGKNQIKTVLGEVLVAKKFSVSAGVSWMKIKPMEFFTARIFKEKNRQDFQKSHPNEVPMAFEILNIKVQPTLAQIPLTVAFRNELKNDFSYFVSTGTNITIRGTESFSFDCRVPNHKSEFLNKTFERKMDIPVVNSLNFSAGIEKTWHPIVVQIEGYAYTYFKQLSQESARTGPGVKIKLLYQIGEKIQTK